jgi:hypothetical protein
MWSFAFETTSAIWTAKPVLNTGDDLSIATGVQGMLFPLLAIPVLGVAVVAWAVATRRLPNELRRATMVATILLAYGVWTLIRAGDFTAARFKNDLHCGLAIPIFAN